MALDTNDLIDRIVSHAARLGVFDVTNGHQVEAAPGRGVTVAFGVVSLGPAPSGQKSTSALVVFEAVVYTSPYTNPLDLIDPAIMTAVDALIEAYSGDFTLGGTVRCVDLLGMSGLSLRADKGFVPFPDGTVYPAMVVTVPLIVNDAWLQAE